MHNILLICGLCIGILAGSGCASHDKPAQARFASVDIHGNTPGQVSQVTEEVFKSHGYRTVFATPTQFVFEKPGTGWQTAMYGGWSNDGGVWVRVKGEVVTVSEALVRIQCHAYVVEDHGQPAFEQERELTNFRSGSYQKLLDEVAARLNPK